MGGMNSSRLTAVAVVLAALTSIEVEACLGEPCNIGNPTMCRLIRETNRAGSMPSHRSLLEPMTPMRRRLSNEDADERKARRGRLVEKKSRYTRSRSPNVRQKKSAGTGVTSYDV